jgi:hypothetical protein
MYLFQFSNSSNLGKKTLPIEIPNPSETFKSISDKLFSKEVVFDEVNNSVSMDECNYNNIWSSQLTKVEEFCVRETLTNHFIMDSEEIATDLAGYWKEMIESNPEINLSFLSGQMGLLHFKGYNSKSDYKKCIPSVMFSFMDEYVRITIGDGGYNPSFFFSYEELTDLDKSSRKYLKRFTSSVIEARAQLIFKDMVSKDSKSLDGARMYHLILRSNALYAARRAAAVLILRNRVVNKNTISGVWRTRFSKKGTPLPRNISTKPNDSKYKVKWHFRQLRHPRFYSCLKWKDSPYGSRWLLVAGGDGLDKDLTSPYTVLSVANPDKHFKRINDTY